jgi:phosphatidylglycerol:prolipoprotein diacylglycerol transferase
MFPVLFKLGGIEIYSYGFLILLGFGVGVFIAVRKAKKANIQISFDRIADLFFYSVLSAFIGSRAFFVLMNLEQFQKNPLEAFMLWKGGLVFYGGFIIAAFVSILYMKRHQMPIWRLADITSPSISIGLFFGRIGCFCAGCCYGKETSLPWGVVFKDPRSLAKLNTSLHPTQLYEAIVGLFLFIFLIKWEKRKRFNGELFFLLILFYSIARFFIEMIRGDPRGFLFDGLLSTSQVIGIFLAVLSIFMLFYLKEHNEVLKDGNS